MRLDHDTRGRLGVAALLVGVLTLAALLVPTERAAAQDAPSYPPPAPLPALDAPDPALAELGKMLFFDERLSGDVAISCATCHDPKHGWGDGQPLSKAYPGSKYFRNAKTLYNVAHARYFHWDGRLSGKDRATLVRDQITETAFLNMDGRIMLERLKQVPDYQQRFRATLGGEPSFGRTLKAVAAFLGTLNSQNVPFDAGKLSPAAKRGQALFSGKAGCVQCHNGPMLSDYAAHKTGVATHPDIVGDPMRHFTMRSVMKFLGVPGFEDMREDPGFFAVSKRSGDEGKFVTPTLRELTHTAPYMHNGTLATLDAVIDFYVAGGGAVDGKDPLLRPLELSAADKADLKAFLESLSGDPIVIEPPELPPYAVPDDWYNTPN